MASRFAERSIPHLRDIFGLPNKPAAKREEPPTGNNNNEKPLKYCAQGSDSAISVDSSEEEICEDGRRGRRKSRRGRESRDAKRGSSACAPRREMDEDEEEFRHLERHLSMKKTIRKRIMRELQGAMVEDPSEFRAERRSAAISAHSLTFRRRRGAPPPLPRDEDNSEEAAAADAVAAAVEQPGFLDMLKLADGDGDSGNDSPTRPSPAEICDPVTPVSYYYTFHFQCRYYFTHIKGYKEYF